MKEIRCPVCGKLLAKSNGELHVELFCTKCKEKRHFDIAEDVGEKPKSTNACFSS